MGLFNRSRQPDPIKQMQAAGGNFNYVAQNIATRYFILTNTNYGWMISDTQRMYAVALMDAAAAARAGDIEMSALSSAAEDAFISRIHLGEYSRAHGEWVDTEFECLCNLVLQIEALMFAAYTNVDPETIMDSIISHKAEIVSTVKRTLQQGKNGPLYEQLIQPVTNMINDHVFRYLVEAFDTIINLQNTEIELRNRLSDQFE